MYLAAGGWLGGGRVVLTSGSGRPRNWRVGGGRGGGAPVQAGGRGKRKIQELAGRERRGGLLQEDTTRATIHIPYIYLVYRRKCTYVGCLGGDQHHV
jgi:hypothetical protein